MRHIYLDHAATTPVDKRVVKEMQPYFSEKFGNTMSLHSFGQEAKFALDQSRQVLADLINSAPNEIIFTSSATESNNLAIKGLANQIFSRLNPPRGAHSPQKNLLPRPHIIISGIGKGKFITGAMIKNGAVLIDAGTSESEGGIVGDIDLESVKDVAGYVSPVPGGVGPVTVAMLLKNVLKVAKSISSK